LRGWQTPRCKGEVGIADQQNAEKDLKSFLIQEKQSSYTKRDSDNTAEEKRPLPEPLS